MAAGHRRSTRWPPTSTDPSPNSRCCADQAADAATVLGLLADAEAEAISEGGAANRGGPPLPAHGWTLAALGRAAAMLGDVKRAAACFRSVTDLTAAGIDPCHPVILTAHCDEAERCAAIGDTSQAAKLLAPVLDRTLLAHGRPALGEAHPMLTKARALAERLGIAVPYPASALNQASLDIDV